MLSARLLLLAAGSLFPAPAARAQTRPRVTAVLSSSLPAYREALEGFEVGFGATVASYVLPDEPPAVAEDGVVVAFGAGAATRRYDDRAALVYALAPAVFVAPEGRAGTTVKVALSPKPKDLLARLKAVQPGLRRLATFWVSEEAPGYFDKLRRLGPSYGVEVEARRLSGPDALDEALRALEYRPDALWLPPDPLLVTADSFAAAKAYAAARKVPLYAASAEFAEMGAAASIEVEFREAGRIAGAEARGVIDGDVGDEVVYPSRLVTTLNARADAACGLVVPPDVARAARAVGGRK